MAYAFFDLDGTILRPDTQSLFAKHVLRTHPWRALLLLPFVCALPLMLLKVLGSHEMKRLFLAYLCGLRPSHIDELARDFAENAFPAHCYPELLAEIERHRREGRTLILNTASPNFYAHHIARVLKFDHCVATPLEITDPMPLVPEIDGPNNKRQAKLPHMAHLLPDSFDPDHPTRFPDSYAYTDSIVDLPLLSCAEHNVLVNPKPNLLAAAPKTATVLTPASPI